MILILCVFLLILWIGNYFIIYNDIIYMYVIYVYFIWKFNSECKYLYVSLICKNNIMRYLNLIFLYIKERKVYFKI